MWGFQGMIVRELIEELLTYNLDAEVVTDYSESVRVGYIEETDNEHFNKSNTPFVFIDGCDLDDSGFESSD